jgi:succinate dehydrogenase/fumarate reductase flavoprotein subunit
MKKDTQDASNPRRSFLKLTGMGAVAAAVSGVLPGMTKTAEAANIYSGALPKKWDGEYELVIVGGGGTGLCAGVEAVQRGVKLFIMEKRPFIGGIAGMATGYLFGGDSRLQQEQGIKNCSREIWWAGVEDGTAWSEPFKRVRDNSNVSPVYYGIAKRNTQLLKDIVWGFPTLIEFLLKYGANIQPLDQRFPFTHIMAKGSLPTIFRNASDEIRSSGGQIVTETRANKIYLDDSGKVAGIRATGADGKMINIKTRALLMASGGFLNNDELIKRYMPYWATKGKVPSAFLFSDGGALFEQTGDGIVMGLELNASLDDMDAGFKYKIAPKNRGDALVNGLAMIQSPLIFVTQEGKRVIDERLNYTIATLNLIRAGAKYGYFVFDETAMSSTGAKNFGFKALVENGAIFKANTLREAALKAGVDPDGLQATVDKFNKDFDEKGVDSVFGKTGPFYQKIIKPPFYVSDKHFPVRFKTEGGLETDERTRVLEYRTVKPIPGFYAAGATNGTCTAALGDTMQCGRMSARYIAEDLKAKKV